MSDQDTPPPMGNFPPEGDVPPPAPANDPLPTAGPPVGNVGLGQGKLNEGDEKMMAMLAHLLGIVTNFVGALVIWLIKREESPFVNDQGKEALNFQITIAIGYLIALVGGFATGGCLSIILWPAVWIASLVFSILGGLEANKGKAYRYPFALRLIS